MTTNQQPLISVIVPVYNGSDFLSEAIDSIRQQMYGSIEIIVVDDGSTDSTPQIINGFASSIQSIRQNNAGPAAARNAGLRLARGEVIGFLDTDDLWPPDKLKIQMQCLMDNPHVEMVMGRIQVIELPGAIKRRHRFNIEQEPAVNVHLGGALFRRSIFGKVGAFDESLRYSEDIDFFMRVREYGIQVAVTDHVTLYYRLHQHNMTHDLAKGDSYLLRAFKKSLDRRRQAHGEAHDLPAMQNIDQLPDVNSNQETTT
jgi:glycosyltransferase involved in cell wall biosynthesis